MWILVGITFIAAVLYGLWPLFIVAFLIALVVEVIKDNGEKTRQQAKELWALAHPVEAKALEDKERAEARSQFKWKVVGWTFVIVVGSLIGSYIDHIH